MSGVEALAIIPPALELAKKGVTLVPCIFKRTPVGRRKKGLQITQESLEMYLKHEAIMDPEVRVSVLDDFEKTMKLYNSIGQKQGTMPWTRFMYAKVVRPHQFAKQCRHFSLEVIRTSQDAIQKDARRRAAAAAAAQTTPDGNPSSGASTAVPPSFFMKTAAGDTLYVIDPKAMGLADDLKPLLARFGVEPLANSNGGASPASPPSPADTPAGTPSGTEDAAVGAGDAGDADLSPTRSTFTLDTEYFDAEEDLAVILEVHDQLPLDAIRDAISAEVANCVPS